jgi:hypothetical protein
VDSRSIRKEKDRIKQKGRQKFLPLFTVGPISSGKKRFKNGSLSMFYTYTSFIQILSKKRGTPSYFLSTLCTWKKICPLFSLAFGPAFLLDPVFLLFYTRPIKKKFFRKHSQVLGKKTI